MSEAAWQATLAAWHAGDTGSARDQLEALLAGMPEHVNGRHLLGVILTECGEADQAVHHLRVVCAAQTDNDQAWSNLGNAYAEAGQPQAAEDALRTGLRINPANPYLHFNLGNVLESLGHDAEAEAAFAAAVLLQPADAEAWLRLGRRRYARADHDGAALAFAQAAALGGANRDVALRLEGFALADGGRPVEAEARLTALLERCPPAAHDLPVLSHLLYCRLELCDWRDIDELTTRVRQALTEGQSAAEPFSFLLLAELSAAEQRSLAERFATPLVRSAVRANTSPHRHAKAVGSTLRLGYLGDVFHEHATAFLAAGVLENHDHARFEVHAFSYGPQAASPMRRRLVSACSAFHEVGEQSPAQIAETIRQTEIDILIDLNGWTGNTRSATLAHRPAPVQVNWLGYPGTLGSAALADYLIGDAVVTPLAAQADYAETLALMPYCYQPNDMSRPLPGTASRTAEGLPEDALVFCCFNRSVKISNAVFNGWCELLHAVPRSVLWLLAGTVETRRNLLAAAARRGIDDKRLVFAPARHQAAHIDRLRLADLVLDTHPYGAHTTASDALWAGVPVVTWLGHTFPSRVAASLLHAAGLPELVASDHEGYLRLALALAHDTPRREELRRRLDARRDLCPLFDTRAYTRDFEALLIAMWQQYQDGCRRPIVGRSVRPA